MRFTRYIKHAGRVFLASAVIGLALVGSSPAKVKANPNPVDLELDTAGYTPLIANDVKPGDSGTKTIELRNVGSKDGFVTIWLSDIVSGEGLNPEPETGDTSEPGEFDEHLILDFTADGLSTNLDLPAAVKDIPGSATCQAYIEIIPLKTGDTKTLELYWELPYDTGNEVQGDELSFTINYLLRECAITDVSGVVTGDGEFTEDVTVYSDTQKGKLSISVNTTGKTATNQPPSDIWLIETDNVPPAPPSGKTAIGFNLDAGPNGTTFDKPITITLSYNPDDIPAGVNEHELVIALWDNDTCQWITLPDCTVDTVAKTISAPITHFSRYGIISPESPPPVYPPPPAGGDEPSGDDDEDTKPNILEVSLLDDESTVEIGADGTLDKTLILADRDGGFTVEIKGGSRITGTGGVPLSRIDLTITEKSLVLPDNTVILSPVYELTGYNLEREVTGIEFNPSAVLTIRYDPEDLPENSFPPFIANYTDEEGLIPLEAPPDSLVEIGKTEALISHASLFVVAAEVAPPPPPLPAHFVASNLIINPHQAIAGEPVTISVTITNEGAITGTYELYLIIDGVVRATKEVTLTGKSSETLTMEVSNLAAGTYQIKVAGLSGTIKLSRVSVEPVGPRVNWLLLDLSVASAVVAALLVWYLYMRRARRRAASN